MAEKKDKNWLDSRTRKACLSNIGALVINVTDYGCSINIVNYLLNIHRQITFQINSAGRLVFVIVQDL